MRAASVAVAGLVLSVGVSGAVAPDVLGVPETVAPAAASSAPAAPEPDVSAGSAAAKDPLRLLDEVVSARTATSRTWATESPGVLQTEISTGPVNYRGPDGAWLPIDTSLVSALSGALLAEKNSFVTWLAPLASGSNLVNLTLGGGRSLGYGLQGAAPAPVVPDLEDTSVATYKKALPGVDVRLRVLGTGVKEELVLAGPNTATQFTFPLTLNGLTAREVAEGVEFVDAAGELVARMPHGWMQDSARPQGAGEGAISDGAKLSLVTVGGKPAIRMTLDSAWLAAPERVFPVVVDPTTTIVTGADDTFVQKSYNMDFSGHEDLKAGTHDSGATPSRSFMHFPLGAITGNDVQSADLRLYANWSYSCNARQLNVRRVTSAWSGSSARWAGPSIGTWNIASPSFAYGYHSSCAARQVAMDVTPAVEHWASGNWDNHGLALVASETDNYAWKRFNSYNAGNNRPHLVVTWSDATPSSITSTSSSTHPNPGVWYAKDDITVSWTASDTGGSGLDGYSYVLDQNSTTVPNTIKNAEQGTTTASFANKANGIWWFHVRARDNAGNWGDPKHRRIRVDTGAPSAIPAVRSTSHTPLLVSFDRQITLEWDPATDAHAGVAGYSVVVNKSQTQQANVKINSDGTNPYTSPVLQDGVYWAHVRAIDAAEHPDTTYDGNPGPDKTYGPFLIGSGALTDLLLPDPVAQSNELGLEQFSPFAATDTGVGSAYTQLRTGNLVTQQDLATVPGQGLNAVLRLTHNAHAANRERGHGKGWTLSVADVEGTIEGALEGLSDGSITDMDVTSDVVLGQTTLIDGVTTLTQDAHYALNEATGNVLEFTDGDGTVHRFVRTGEQGSRWDAPPGVDLQLREVEKEVVDAAGATVKVVDYFELTRPDGVVYKVTRQDQALSLPLPLWRVSEITDRNGNKLAFTHANQGPAGVNQSRLTEIRMTRVGSSTAGELVATLTYTAGTLTAPARLATLETLPGHATLARTTALAYDTDGRMVAVEENTQRPSGAADRRKVLYTYNTDHTIATVSDGLVDTATSATAAQRTTFSYTTSKIDAEDRKALPRVTSMLDRAGKTWSWSYKAKTGTTTGERETTATRPFSGTTTRSTTYTFSGRGTVDSDADTRVAGGNVTAITDPGTDAGPVTNRYEWYANKLIASVDGLGNRTGFTYNGLGLLTTVTSPPPNRPGHEGLPAGAPTDPVTSTLTYQFPAGSAPSTCAAPGYGAGRPVTAEGLCAGAVGELTKVTVADSVDAQQRIADFSYDARGNLITMVERAKADGSANVGDRTSRFAYYANGALARIDGPRTDVTDVTCYGWAATNTTDCDTTNAPASGGYHATGLPTVVKDALGNKRTFTYHRYGMKTQVVDRDGATTSSIYNALNDMVSATVPGAQTTRYGYDRNGNKTTETSPGSKTTTWSYDALDRLASVTSPGSITTSYAYFDDGSANFIDGPLTGTADRTSYAYFPNGAVKTITAPAATGKTAVTDHAYDAAGQLIRTTQPVANAAGHRPVIALTLTPSGDVQVNGTTASTGAAGNTDRRVTTYYNAHSEPITQTGPRTVGSVLQRSETTYDSFGQALEVARTVTGSKKLLYKTGYDLAGNQISSAQPTGNGATLEAKYKFDALNQLAEQHVDPVNVDHRVSYEYTGEGQQSRRIDWKQDPLGNVNTPCSNALALCTKQRQVDTTFNPDNSQASMVYTDFTVGTSDPQRMKATCNYAAGQAVGSGYDADGNLTVTRTVAGPGAVGTDVCATGTLWREQTFTYDTRGLMSGTVQKVRSPGTGDLVARTQSFTYHADGTRASFTHDGHTTTYQASPAGWNESVTDWRGKTSTTSYLANGGVDAVSLGGGRATAALGYHNDGSMADFTWKATPGTDPAVVVREHTGITYDVGGLRTGETVRVRNPAATELTGAAASYSHDVLDRLVGFTSPFAYKTGAGATGADAKQPVVAYNLDDGGNITAEVTTVGGVERRRVTNTYGTGRLTRSADRTIDGLQIAENVTNFTYNPLGEETRRKLTTNLPLGSNVNSQTDSAYDAAGHTKASTNTANLGNGAPAEDVERANTDVTYRYDTGDRVISRSETKPNKPAEHTLLFYMAGSGNLAEESDAQGDTKIRYLLDADGEALAQQTYKVTDGDADGTGMKWTWLLNDAVGNTATLVGDDGAVIEHKAFDPYGAELQGGSKRTETTDAPRTTLGFQGARTDEATGRVMLGPRQYDPSSGRFTSPDFFVAGALDLQLGTDALTGNRYLFAGAMPTTYYEDGHGFGSWLKKKAKKVAPVLEYVPVVSTAVDVVNAATGKNWYEGGRPMSGAERMMALGGAGLGLIPGGNAAKAGVKAATKGLDKANSARKVRKAEACPIGNSFTLDTPVLMADGTTSPIGELEVGDLVWSTDPYTGEAGPRPVTAVIDGEGAKTLVAITTSDGQTFVATDAHPIFVVNEEGWVDATDLRPGDQLADARGGHGAIAAVDVSHVTAAAVRNLTVAALHTFHVGKPDSAYLVHNDGCGSAKEPGKFRRSLYKRPSKKQRDEILERDPICVYCLKNPSSTVDHIKSVFRHWVTRGFKQDRDTRSKEVNSAKNLAGACRACNSSKNKWDIGVGPGQWWPSGWPRGTWWPFGGK